MDDSMQFRVFTSERFKLPELSNDPLLLLDERKMLGELHVLVLNHLL